MEPKTTNWIKPKPRGPRLSFLSGASCLWPWKPSLSLFFLAVKGWKPSVLITGLSPRCCSGLRKVRIPGTEIQYNMRNVCGCDTFFIIQLTTNLQPTTHKVVTDHDSQSNLTIILFQLKIIENQNLTFQIRFLVYLIRISKSFTIPTRIAPRENCWI